MATIELTESALRNIEHMYMRVFEIENKHGLDHEATKIAKTSLLSCLMTLFRWPGSVYAEDDLSLIISSTITIGIIWHPVRYREEDGSLTTDPLLGEWSSHS